MQLKQLEIEAMKEKEGAIEDRKDSRSKQEATQQSRMITQRQNELPPENFKEEVPQSGRPVFQPEQPLPNPGMQGMPV